MLLAVAMLPSVIFVSLPRVLRLLLARVSLAHDLETLFRKFLHLLLVELTVGLLLGRRLQACVALLFVTVAVGSALATVVLVSTITAAGVSTSILAISSRTILALVLSAMLASVLTLAALAVLIFVGTLGSVSTVLGLLERPLLVLSFLSCGSWC